jgi:CRP-like cAMP-binding protein
LYNAPRSATVKALEHCYLWGIDRNTFRRAVEEMITKEYEENRKFMEVVRFFRIILFIFYRIYDNKINKNLFLIIKNLFKYILNR